MAQIEHFGPLAGLTEWAVSTGAFQRNKMPVEKKILAAALCNTGYSYRQVAKMLGGLSYVAARDSYLSLVTTLPEETKRRRREIAIDGADLRVDGQTFYLWLARDVDTGEIMSFNASPTGSAEDGSRFLAIVAAQCSNKPLLRLGSGQSHPKGLINLDLYFQSVPTPSIIGRIGRLLLGTALSSS